MKQLVRKFGLVLALLVLALPMTQAQDAPPALYGILNGAVMRLNGAGLDFYGACQPGEGIQAPILLAPDGRYFAMSTQPEVVRQAIIAQGSAGGRIIPANLWVCDTLAGRLIKVNDQPTDAVFMAGDIPDKVTVRSTPAWSPDGLALAWSEIRYPDNFSALMIYNLPKNQVSEIALTGFPVGGGLPAPPAIYWGKTGLMALYFTLDDTTFQSLETAYIFDNEGNYKQATLVAKGGEQDDFVVERLLIEHEGKEYWGLLYNQAGWVLVDALTGVAQPMPGIPELYNLANASGISLLVQVTPEYAYNWQIFDPANPAAPEPLQFKGYAKSRLALAPDGITIAYAPDTVQLVSTRGSSVDLANSAGFAADYFASMVWSPTAWRVRGGVKFATVTQ